VKFLAQEKEVSGVTDDQFTPDLLKAEAAQVWELFQAGIIREMYFRADKHEAVLILECTTLNEVEQALDSLPLVHAHLIAFEVAPLIPYDGFARLFEKRSLK
jgi:hypothetical protein